MDDLLVLGVAADDVEDGRRALGTAGPGPAAGRHAAPEARWATVSIHDPVDANWLEVHPRLQAVVTRSAGHDHVDLDAARRRGVAVYTLGDYAADAVADHAVAMLLSLLHRIPQGQDAVRSGWRREGLVGRHLGAATVGVIGSGAIGGRTALRLAALGCPAVKVYDIVPDAVPTHPRIRGVPFDEAMACDAVTLHVPLDDATRGLVGSGAIGRMPPGAVLVNTARGGVVDLDAVLGALDAGALSGYAADVLAGEPDPPGRARLARRSDVILTPHIAAYSRDVIAARWDRTAAILDALRAGRDDEVAPYRVA